MPCAAACGGSADHREPAVVALAEASEDQPPPGNEMVSVTEEEMGDIAVEGFGAGSQPEREEERLPAPEEDKEAPVEEEAEETPASDTEPGRGPHWRSE